jgi:hypothetical protein
MPRATAIRRGLVAAVAVGVGLGVVTACGGSSASAYKLPSCAQLGNALPSKPALTFEGGLVDHTKASTNRLAARFVNDTYEMCTAGNSEVDVYLLGSGTYDLVTNGKYPDGQAHDGTWRAQQLYQHMTRSFLTAPLGTDGISSFAYSSELYVDTQCDMVVVTKNAVINVDVRNPQQPQPGQAPTALLASCVPIGTTDLPAVVGTL